MAQNTADPHDLVVDKSGWEPGPWHDEPDRIQWRTAVGLPGLAVRGPMGNWCGYAGIAKNHPWHGIGYSNCPSGCDVESWCEHSPDCRVEVHGGLTYAARCQEDGPICHVPEPGEPDDIWWFGFDCGHHLDFSPGMEFRLPVEHRSEAYGLERGTYRELPYVRDQVESLARQLAEVGRG